MRPVLLAATLLAAAGCAQGSAARPFTVLDADGRIALVDTRGQVVLEGQEVDVLRSVCPAASRLPGGADDRCRPRPVARGVVLGLTGEERAVVLLYGDGAAFRDGDMVQVRRPTM